MGEWVECAAGLDMSTHPSTYLPESSLLLLCLLLPFVSFSFSLFKGGGEGGQPGGERGEEAGGGEGGLFVFHLLERRKGGGELFLQAEDALFVFSTSFFSSSSSSSFAFFAFPLVRRVEEFLVGVILSLEGGTVRGGGGDLFLYRWVGGWVGGF